MKVNKIVDTETCGLGGGIIQIGSVEFDYTEGGCFIGAPLVHLTNPDIEIELGAMVIHGITELDIKGKPSIENLIGEHLPPEGGYFIGHNTKFNLKMINLECGDDKTNLSNTKALCTLELARALYPKGVLLPNGRKVINHKLGTLFYAFMCYTTCKLEGSAHDSGVDSLMTASVLKHMLRENHLTLDEAYELSQPLPVGKQKVWMKKYRDSGITWEELIVKDEGYCKWILGNFDFKEDQKDLEEFLKEKLNDI